MPGAIDYIRKLSHGHHGLLHRSHLVTLSLCASVHKRSDIWGPQNKVKSLPRGVPTGVYELIVIDPSFGPQTAPVRALPM